MSSRADGSAYVESEGSKVVAAVYGPRPSKKAEYLERAEIRCDVKLATFAQKDKRKTPGQTDEEKAWSATLERTLAAVVLLEKYPKVLAASLGPQFSCVLAKRVSSFSVCY